MKKFILPLLLILSISMLIAVESEASDVVGYVKYELVNNANGNSTLIALPMGVDYSVASDIGNAYSGTINAVTRWDANSQVWASAYKVGDTWYGDFPVAECMSYMVDASVAADFYSIGALNDPINYTIVNNANGNSTLIMVPMNRSDLLEADDLGDDIGVANSVTRWDADGQVWASAYKVGETWYGNFGIGIAMPLMIDATEATVWGGIPETRTTVNSRSKK